MTEKITMIDINKIDPHPDNPRKDLGDLTELAESIKANGVMQNLTVVPWFSTTTRKPADDNKMDGHYVALIGHRRLAAAKKAGLKEVPCTVIDGLSQIDRDLTYHDWHGYYEKNEQLDFVYEILCYFGYELSDEETALKNGTHDAYRKKEETL